MRNRFRDAQVDIKVAVLLFPNKKEARQMVKAIKQRRAPVEELLEAAHAERRAKAPSLL